MMPKTNSPRTRIVAAPEASPSTLGSEGLKAMSDYGVLGLLAILGPAVVGGIILQLAMWFDRQDGV